jgi:hypothetical protein
MDAATRGELEGVRCYWLWDGGGWDVADGMGDGVVGWGGMDLWLLVLLFL